MIHVCTSNVTKLLRNLQHRSAKVQIEQDALKLSEIMYNYVPATHAELRTRVCLDTDNRVTVKWSFMNDCASVSRIGDWPRTIKTS